ncbi:MAG: enoyl-CoA hydratase/isomerase family protein [Hyphomicrobiales bacterium]|nr:MAG: enoyl-CoA hydratase/isomerase family protein [Hyphomicrobiales bacterium]
MGVTDDAEILVRREGRAGRLTLNRPKALNALTYGMVMRMWEALNEWAADPAVELVLLDGAGERALCAGGDVRSLYDSRTEGSQFARKFWADEYRLNALIKTYPKPYVAIQDGIVMGGGIGVSGHASHRIVTERSHLAMPETTIGLIPDVGGTWLLGHAPGEAGVYLGLTSAPMNAADAIHARFSDTFCATEKLGALKAQLCDPKGGSIDTVIAGLAGNPGPSSLAQHAGDIDAGFAADTVQGVIDRLDAIGSEWALKAKSALGAKSPKAMQLTLAATRQARALPSLEAALEIEYRLVCRLFEDGEFPEGVRALIVDKDRAPKWSPASLDALPADLVAAYLAPLPPGQDLDLSAH